MIHCNLLQSASWEKKRTCSWSGTTSSNKDQDKKKEWVYQSAWSPTKILEPRKNMINMVWWVSVLPLQFTSQRSHTKAYGMIHAWYDGVVFLKSSIRSPACIFSIHFTLGSPVGWAQDRQADGPSASFHHPPHPRQAQHSLVEILAFWTISSTEHPPRS